MTALGEIGLLAWGSGQATFKSVASRGVSPPAPTQKVGSRTDNKMSLVLTYRFSLARVALTMFWLALALTMAGSLAPPWAPSLVLALLSVSALALHLADRRFLAFCFTGAAAVAACYWLLITGVAE